MMTAAGGEVLNVEDVFSADVWIGNETSRSIVNNVDLSTHGGAVWLKSRNENYTNHYIANTESGVYNHFQPNNNSNSYTTQGVTAFNSDGYSIGTLQPINRNTKKIVGWTFRKAPKFFDVVEYTAQSGVTAIEHNLGCVPGMMLIYDTSANQAANYWHNGLTSQQSSFLQANTANDEGSNTGMWNNTAPTATHFYVGNNDTNRAGDTYIALLWAHNNGDGEFGLSGDQDIIKCGSYYGGGSPKDIEIDLGFEPQLVWINSMETNSYGWFAVDSTRTTSEYYQNYIKLHSYDDEQLTSSNGRLQFTGKGFRVQGYDDDINGQNKKFVYMAIRKGPMAEATSADDFFEIGTWHDGSYDSVKPAYRTDWKPDFGFERRIDSSTNWDVGARNVGNKRFWYTNSNNGSNGSNAFRWDYSTPQAGWYEAGGTNANVLGWTWRYSVGIFDCHRYEGNGQSSQVVPHNLGVTPEMIWVKNITGGQNWYCYYPNAPQGKWLILNDNSNGDGTAAGIYPFQNLSSTSVTYADASNLNSGAYWTGGTHYISLLFASKSGIVKCGTFTGNGGSQTINCGFSNGSKFIIIKKTSGVGDWGMWDTYRGINSGGDPRLYLNRNYAQDTHVDTIDYHSSGFTVNEVQGFNSSGSSYMFYAIATP